MADFRSDRELLISIDDKLRGGTPLPEKKNGLAKFNSARWIFFSVMAVLLFGLSVLMFAWNSLLFLLPSGFFVATLGILFMLIVDQKLIRGDTFEKISNDTVALSIVLVVIAIYFWIGINIAQSYIPDAFRNEASSGYSKSIKQPGGSAASELDAEPTGDERTPCR